MKLIPDLKELNLYPKREGEGKVPARMLSRFSLVRLFATPWTVTCQVPLPMGFSRQAYWIGLPFPPPGDLPDPGIEPESLALAVKFFTTKPPRKHLSEYIDK